MRVGELLTLPPTGASHRDVAAYRDLPVFPARSSEVGSSPLLPILEISNKTEELPPYPHTSVKLGSRGSHGADLPIERSFQSESDLVNGFAGGCGCVRTSSAEFGHSNPGGGQDLHQHGRHLHEFVPSRLLVLHAGCLWLLHGCNDRHAARLQS